MSIPIQIGLGITNNLKYKSVSLGFTFDYTKGGQILSFTSALYKSRGAWIETGNDRDKPRVLPGVIESHPANLYLITSRFLLKPIGEPWEVCKVNSMYMTLRYSG